MNFYSHARAVLFRMDAERAHDLVLGMLSRYPWMISKVFGSRFVADPVDLMGLHFPNRVGLAAGWDKDGRCLDGLQRFGFGFVEIGTVTPRPQTGNPRPRLFRVPQCGALINRMGFNNIGVDALVENVRKTKPSHCILGVNIGKNAATALKDAVDDYLLSLRAVFQVADYVAVNISSPNTPGLRNLQGHEEFAAFIGPICQERDKLAQQFGMQRPLLVKVAPDMDFQQLEWMASIARDAGVDGLIATNTTVSCPDLVGTLDSVQSGGLSGSPLRPKAEAAISLLRKALGPDFPLIGVGGIDSAESAQSRIKAGADLVQIFTGLIYRGPRLVRECAEAIAELPSSYKGSAAASKSGEDGWNAS